MESAPNVGQAFFPLDEELGLQPGSLTPLQLDHLVHLSLWMPFRRAVKLLSDVTGVQVSEATGRRQTEAAGAIYEALQDEQADRLCGEKSGQETPESKPELREQNGHQEEREKSKEAAKLLVSSDGAYVPLVDGSYAEVKTVVIGEVHPKEKHCKERPDQQVETINLSYFSRLADAESFGKLATVETERRGVRECKEVCAIQDGASWIQGFVDLQRPDALRILDFTHAKDYLVEIADLVKAAGTDLPVGWLDKRCHELKHHGPAAVLQEIGLLLENHPGVPDLDTKVNYLRKREQQMQYPLYQQLGWPIGSGSVESANKCVVQARLKGPGMRWERSHVNPMLALRTEVSHDRWPEAWEQTSERRCQQRMRERLSRHLTRRDQVLQDLRLLVVHIVWLASPAPHPITPVSSVPKANASAATNAPSLSPPPGELRHDPSSQSMPPPPCISSSPTSPPACRPGPSHPWRRYPCAKK